MKQEEKIIMSGELEDNSPSQKISLPLRDKLLPPIIREVVGNAPANRKIPCLIACLSPLCALATRVRTNYYYDGERISALLLQVIIEAPQSSGKQFAADIEKLIMDNTLKSKDQEQRRLEQNYREKKRTRAANQKMEEEPKTTIRVIPATISKTVLVKRADYYERNLGDVLSFWMFAEELAQVTDAGKQGYSNLRTIMRTAYDFGSRFGIDYASDNSYSAIVDINICSMFCTTPSALDDYMDKKAIEGGNITRTVLCQLEDEMGSDGALFKPYTDVQLANIKSILDKIMADCYKDDDTLQPEIFLDSKWLEKDIRAWCVSKGDEALKTGSMAIDVFRKRSSVSAFRATMLCYYLYILENNGKDGGLTENQIQWRCKQLYRFFADYILSTLLRRWGKRFEELQGKRDEADDQGISRYRIIDRLPETFTRTEFDVLMQKNKCATPSRILISVWKKKNWIIETEKYQYKKIKDS